MTTTIIGSPPDPFNPAFGALVFKVSEDAWQGDAQLALSVDGNVVGGPITVTASHAAGEQDTIIAYGPWTDQGVHQAAITFLNDAWGGTPATDRNLYVDSGAEALLWIPRAAGIEMMQAGTVTIPFAESIALTGKLHAPDATTQINSPSTGPDTLSVKFSNDIFAPWSGGGNDVLMADFKVSIDGQFLFENTFSWSQNHLGQADTLIVHGTWGAGPHTVTVEFLNDRYDAATGYDVNLYIKEVTYNGLSATNGSHDFLWNGSHDFAIPGVGTPPPPPPPASTDWNAIAARVTAYHEATGQWVPYEQIPSDWMPPMAMASADAMMA